MRHWIVECVAQRHISYIPKVTEAAHVGTCHAPFVREIKDPAKMTYPRMDFTKRDRALLQQITSAHDEPSSHGHTVLTLWCLSSCYVIAGMQLQYRAEQHAARMKVKSGLRWLDQPRRRRHQVLSLNAHGRSCIQRSECCAECAEERSRVRRLPKGLPLVFYRDRGWGAARRRLPLGTAR